MQGYRVVAEVIEITVEHQPNDPFTKSSYPQLGNLHLSLNATGPAVCDFPSMVNPVATELWDQEPDRQCSECLGLLSSDSTTLGIIETHGSDGVIGTEALAHATYEAAKDAGTNATFYATPPWFGREPELRRLERLGLIEIDPGMAQAVPAGSAASSAGEYAVIVTDSGRALIAESGAGE